MVTLTVNSELGSGDKAEAEHCMDISDVSCTMIGGSVMDSVIDRDRLNEAQCRYRKPLWYCTFFSLESLQTGRIIVF